MHEHLPFNSAFETRALRCGNHRLAHNPVVAASRPRPAGDFLPFFPLRTSPVNAVIPRLFTAMLRTAPKVVSVAKSIDSPRFRSQRGWLRAYTSRPWAEDGMVRRGRRKS